MASAGARRAEINGDAEQELRRPARIFELHPRHALADRILVPVETCFFEAMRRTSQAGKDGSTQSRTTEGPDHEHPSD